jgi:hypothetical protein
MKRIELNNGKILSLLLLLLGNALLQNKVVEASVYVDSDYFRHHSQITSELVDFIKSAGDEDLSKWIDELILSFTVNKEITSLEKPINPYLTFFYSHDILQRLKTNHLSSGQTSRLINILQRNNIWHLSSSEDPLS